MLTVVLSNGPNVYCRIIPLTFSVIKHLIIYYQTFMNAISLKNVMNADKALFIPTAGDHSLLFAHVLTIFVAYMSVKQ